MDKEFFKFGPLMAEVKRAVRPGLLRVTILGEGEEFSTLIPWPSEDWRRLSYEVIYELTEAARFPRRFLAHRRIAAEQASESPDVRNHMVHLAQKAIEFAKAMQPFLERALHSSGAIESIRNGGI